MAKPGKQSVKDECRPQPPSRKLDQTCNTPKPIKILLFSQLFTGPTDAQLPTAICAAIRNRIIGFWQTFLRPHLYQESSITLWTIITG